MAKQRIIKIVYDVDKRKVDAARGSVEKADKATKDLTKSTNQAGEAGESAFTKMKNAIVATGLIALVGGLAKKIFDLGAAQQQTNVAFETFLGNAEKARKLIGELTKFSVVTPFTPDQVFKSAKALLAFGVEADKIIPTLKRLGDVSAGTGKDLTEMAIIFGQIRSTGRLMGQDLLQLINAGFNPLQVISEKTGRSVADLKKDMEKGLISFEMVDDAFKSATEQGGLFFNLMEKQSQTVSGKLSTLTGNLEEMGKQLFEVVEGPLTAFIDAMGSWVASLVTVSEEQEKALKSSARLFLQQQTDLLKTNQTLEERRKTMRYIVETQKFLGEFQPGTTEDPLPWVTEDKNKLTAEQIALLEKLKKALEDALNTFDKDLFPEEIEILPLPDPDKLSGALEEFNDKIKKNLEKLGDELDAERKEQYDREYDELVEKNERELAEERRAAEEKKRIREATTEFVISSLQQIAYMALLTRQEDFDDERARFDERLALAGDNERARQQIMFERERAEEEFRRRQKAAEKRNAKTRILIDTAAGIARAVAESPTTFGLPFSAFVALTGALQVAAVGKYAKGVIDIQGPGSKTSDSIPAMLSRGESVMTADETTTSRGILKAIRAKKLDDKIIDKLYKGAKGTDGGVVWSDERIVKELIKNRPPDYMKQGSFYMEGRQKSEILRRYVHRRYLG